MASAVQKAVGGASVNGYRVIYERGPDNWSAYVPALPGCIATGTTRTDTQQNMAIALRAHLEGMREDGLTIPRPDDHPSRGRPVPQRGVSTTSRRRTRSLARAKRESLR